MCLTLTLLTLTRWPSRCAPRARVRCRCEATNSSATARSERRCWTRSCICSTAAAAPRSADSSAACRRRRLTRPCSRSPGALLSESAGRTLRITVRVLLRRACSRPRLRGAQTWRVAAFAPAPRLEFQCFSAVVHSEMRERVLQAKSLRNVLGNSLNAGTLGNHAHVPWPLQHTVLLFCRLQSDGIT